MAKSQTARTSTIKNDPFETLIPDRVGEQANEEAQANNVVMPLRPEQAPQPQPEASKAESQKKEKLTVHLTHDLIERVK